MPQPQQLGIRAVSATWTTAHGNAGSLTYWARPGIEPATSWFLVRFISAAPRWEVLFFEGGGEFFMYCWYESFVKYNYYIYLFLVCGPSLLKWCVVLKNISISLFENSYWRWIVMEPDWEEGRLVKILFQYFGQRIMRTWKNNNSKYLHSTYYVQASF